ncbi:GTPase activating protein [Cryptococcus neoformans Tu401-1]|nr:GTPase activating protein [Cryptococcus neoformans var. grubii Tu401-1]OXM78767.1 GTPase activating protein [Cryptococcus neoformans var. grubii Bt63]
MAHAPPTQLGPSIAPPPPAGPSRDSTLESAGQAADIFDLYGANEESMTGSWEGPMGALYEDCEAVQEQPGQIPETTPNINIITSPPAPPSPSHSQSPSHSRPHTPIKHRFPSIISPRTDSTANSPVRYSDIQRLSPANTGSKRGSMSTGIFSGTDGTRSQTSVAASSRYPGEEEDAFHVRSTYARLGGEGVHGDGWDQGVERTRGGPTMADKRMTVFPPSKNGDIGEKERQFLASLDRYGFVNDPHRNRSESRVVSVPSSSLIKIPKMPITSSLSGKPPAQPNNNFAPTSDPGPTPKPPKSPRTDPDAEMKAKRKEGERVKKWGKMMKVKRRDGGGNIIEWQWSRDGEGAKLANRVYKGIPDRWRMAAWWTLAEEQVQKWNGKGKGKSTAQQLISDYTEAVNLPSTFDVQIDLDVPRTISGHTMFVTRYGTGQRNLWHVLHAFSQLCPTCGYVQGMGPIVATLLCYYDPERAYSLMVRLHDVYGMHEIFEPGFPGLLEAFYVQERLMEWLIPDLYQSFQRNMISTTAWGTKWYITLFVNTVPFSQQLRIWDVLWMEGRDAIIITSLAILWSFRDVFAAPNASFESILSLLSSYFVPEDEGVFMQWIKKMLSQKKVREKMDGWRMEWKTLVKEGKSGSALL